MVFLDLGYQYNGTQTEAALLKHTININGRTSHENAPQTIIVYSQVLNNYNFMYLKFKPTRYFLNSKVESFYK